MNQPKFNLIRGSSQTRQLTERKVGIGELEVVRGDFLLKTLLGSCIGLILYDASSRIGGMSHIVHPDSNGQTTPPGKYADTAIAEMLRQIDQLGGKPRNVSARFAGGANMFATTGRNSIGDQNIAAVENLLKAFGIPVLGRHCGGKQGRRLAFEVDTGRAMIEIVGSPAIEL